MEEIRTVQHFAVPAQPGAPGPMSTPLKGDVSALPPVLKAALTAGTGQRFVFACNPRLASGMQHVMTPLACHVNCLKCRATRAWIEAPDDGPFPKEPGKAKDDGLKEYLEPPAAPAKAA